jgi:AraC-like DNA-binding protein
LLADLALGTAEAGKVRTRLVRDVANRPTIAKVANLLKTTPRTLRRRLRAQDTSFRQLSDELRIHVRYLRETKMTVQDIAFALGFSDAANFRHVFGGKRQDA